MMKQLGLEEIDGVEEVIIRTREKEYVIAEPSVTMMKVQGQTVWQVTGEAQEGIRGGSIKAVARVAIPDEDVKLVAEKAGVSEEEARQALEECNGEPAEAIIRLMGR
jgi:nascent polypeptide-associated complex subunit alpha